MSLPHHGRTPERLFLEQMLGQSKRSYSAGRMGAEDDGDLAFAIATDVPHQTIVVKFPKPVEWIGLDRESAERLRDELTARLLELRGITT